jgi:hypothetical protein
MVLGALPQSPRQLILQLLHNLAAKTRAAKIPRARYGLTALGRRAAGSGRGIMSAPYRRRT